jgi:hypothetical protein
VGVSVEKFGALQDRSVRRKVMAAEWSLGYGFLGEGRAVSPVDEPSIERTLNRLNGAETSVCQITHESHQFMVCHGGPDKFIVVYAGIPPGFHWSPGFVPAKIFRSGSRGDRV